MLFGCAWNCIYMALTLCSDNRAIKCVCVDKEGDVCQMFSCLYVDLCLIFRRCDSVIFIVEWLGDMGPWQHLWYNPRICLEGRRKSTKDRVTINWGIRNPPQTCQVHVVLAFECWFCRKVYRKVTAEWANKQCRCARGRSLIRRIPLIRGVWWGSCLAHAHWSFRVLCAQLHRQLLPVCCFNVLCLHLAVCCQYFFFLTVRWIIFVSVRSEVLNLSVLKPP